jgi:putative endonuclease
MSPLPKGGGRSIPFDPPLEGPVHAVCMSRTYFVYILASDSRELYVGVTNDLYRRLSEHRSGRNPNSYSSRHRTFRLVYWESTNDVRAAIRREKHIKRWKRVRRVELIEQANPDWRDLAEEIPGQRSSAPSLREG